MGLGHSACLGVSVQKCLGGAGNLLRNDGTFLTRLGLVCQLEIGLEGQVIC